MGVGNQQAMSLRLCQSLMSVSDFHLSPHKAAFNGGVYELDHKMYENIKSVCWRTFKPTHRVICDNTALAAWPQAVS